MNNKKIKSSIIMILFIGMVLTINHVGSTIHLPPSMIESPNDLTYEKGTTGHTLTWVFEAGESNDSPDQYNISIDGTVLPGHNEATWQDNQDITVNVDGLSVGEHMVEIVVWDTGYPDNADATEDTAIVTVTSTPEVQVTTSNQYLVGSYVSVDAVIHNSSNGWIVIHANDGGSPGMVIGYSNISEGINSEVRVDINSSAVTTTLFAMLHNDTGTIGTYEFPTSDAPMKYSNGSIIMDSFDIMGMVDPSVTVKNGQPVKPTTGQVNVPSVVSPGGGWIVIHADDAGSPGTIVGRLPLDHGNNTEVIVDITGSLTSTLYAMLHIDNGTRGTFEFPGVDVPVKVNGSVVVKPFSVTIQTSSSTTSTTTSTTSTSQTTNNSNSSNDLSEQVPNPVLPIVVTITLLTIPRYIQRDKE